jgi:hypothetical protein
MSPTFQAAFPQLLIHHEELDHKKAKADILFLNLILHVRDKSSLIADVL